MEKPSNIRRLVMVGACYVDTILSVPHFPQEDHKLRASSLERRRGGNVANSLEVLQQLFATNRECPIELMLLCVLPAKTSPGTKLVEDSLGPNVNMSHCIYRDDHQEPASSYIIKADDSGSRTIVNYNELPEMAVEEFKHQVAAMGDAGNTWFHFEGREVETSVACMKWLKQQYPGKITLSAEVEKPNREGLDRMAAEADVVFFSKTWAEAQGFSNASGLLKAQAASLQHARLLCCTWGAEGASACVPGTRTMYQHRPSVDPTRQVVDTIGAGDTFVAGVLYSVMASPGNLSDDPRECTESDLRFASRLATKKVFQQGFGNMATLAGGL